ncbi:MAG: flavin reductase family protein [Planctomycetota bacterium]
MTPSAPKEAPPPSPEALAAALGRIPSGVFILTAGHEDRRTGLLVRWVQQTCFEPPMVSVCVAKGRPIMPIISESRQFGLCQLGEDDRTLARKFEKDPEHGDDPFLGFDLAPSALPNLPLLRSALTALECELACHMDVEGDHDLLVGRVRNASAREGAPRVRVRENGLAY